MTKKERKNLYSQMAIALNNGRNKDAYEMVTNIASEEGLFILTEYRGNSSEPALLEALEKAKQFIENGIELGYIRMPDADTPDSAHNTLPMINASIAAARGE